MLNLLIDPSRVSEFHRLQLMKQGGAFPQHDNHKKSLIAAQIRHLHERSVKIDSFTRKEGPEFRNESVLVGESSLGVTLSDGTVVIPIQESLDYKPSIYSYYGYCTSLMEVSYCFDQAMANPKVSRIVFAIDSPGGVYTGTPELAAKVYAARSSKQIIAVADPCAASGAIWLGRAAEKFYCLSSGSVGSIGCLTIHQEYSAYFASMGIVTTIIRDPERKAEFNYLEPLTEVAKADATKMVEDIALEFQTAIAKYCKTSVKNVQENFGGGSMLDARKAQTLGLIDGLVTSLDEILLRNGRVNTQTSVRLNPKVAAIVAKRQV